MPVSAHTADSAVPLFFQLAEAGFNFIKHLGGFHRRVLEGLEPIGVQRGEHSRSVVVEHRDTDKLPPPAEIAASIVEDLQNALEQFMANAEDLGGKANGNSGPLYL